MNSNSTTAHRLFTLLEGIWTGEGHGGYPTVTSFDYRETLIFTHRDETSLAYEQRTHKRYDGQTEWLVSHWENGFIRLLESGDLELINAQMSRSEVLSGTVESNGPMFIIHFVSRTITNDPRMISSARRFEVEDDTLRYEMEMQTTAVERSLIHLKIELRRTK